MRGDPAYYDDCLGALPLPTGEGGAERRVRGTIFANIVPLIRPFGPPSPVGRRTRPQIALLFALFLLATPAYPQSVRDHTRPTNAGTQVTDSQAVDLTLTLSKASVRPIQQVLRTAGSIDKVGKVLTAYAYLPNADLVKVGQRVRSFPLESKSSMYQAKITRVVPEKGRALVQATLAGPGRAGSSNYLIEIIVERGESLSVPNEAIIEEGDKHIVYIQMHPGHYVPQEIHTGLQGELYTQVLHGLNEGDQVVTFGSFFIDSEYKLKSTGQSEG